jgi:hypothetical protein
VSKKREWVPKVGKGQGCYKKEQEVGWEGQIRKESEK